MGIFVYGGEGAEEGCCFFINQGIHSGHVTATVRGNLPIDKPCTVQSIEVYYYDFAQTS
jgi:hypothetical protein